MGTRKAFTMIELVMVLAIVALMGSIFIPAVDKAKTAIAGTVCTSNLRQWSQIWKLYTDEHGFFMERGGGTSATEGVVAWYHSLRSAYEPNFELLICPLATKTDDEGGINPHMAWDVTTNSGDYYKGSYGINLWVANGCGDDCSDGGSGPGYDSRCWRTPNVAGASSAPLLLCSQWKDAQPYPEDEPLAYETNTWTPGPENEMRRSCIKRHDPYNVNVLFLDWSVGSTTIKELWRLKWHREWPGDYPLPVWPEWMTDVPEP